MVMAVQVRQSRAFRTGSQRSVHRHPIERPYGKVGQIWKESYPNGWAQYQPS